MLGRGPCRFAPVECEQRPCPFGLAPGQFDGILLGRRFAVGQPGIHIVDELQRPGGVRRVLLQQQPGMNHPQAVDLTLVVTIAEQRQRAVGERQRLSDLATRLGDGCGGRIGGAASRRRPGLVRPRHEISCQPGRSGEVAPVVIRIQHRASEPDVLHIRA